MSAACVVAIVATYRRPREIARLLDSLARSTPPVRAAVIVDNSGDLAVESPLEIRKLTPDRNLGCGGGLALAEQEALAAYGPVLTHLWILDDDAVVEPDTLSVLLAAMTAHQAEVVHPLTVDGHGQLGWFPGLLDAEKFRAVKKSRTPEEYLASCGPVPVPFSWSQGIALLVTRRALELAGPHRTDFLVRGEDLEFSLRLTARFTGMYVPTARVQHLPPPVSGDTSSAAEYFKHRAMLQNIAYLTLRLPHGHRLARTIPGNWWRFLRTWHWRPSVVKDAIVAFVRGALQGKPAGAD